MECYRPSRQTHRSGLGLLHQCPSQVVHRIYVVRIGFQNGVEMDFSRREIGAYKSQFAQVSNEVVVLRMLGQPFAHEPVRFVGSTCRAQCRVDLQRPLWRLGQQLGFSKCD